MHTQRQCRDVAWPIIKELDGRHGIGLKYNETRLEAIFPNGSGIYFYGADKPQWIPVMRGQKNLDCAVDEAQDFAPDMLDHLVHRVLWSTLKDHQGSLWLGGTPGEIENLFYHVTEKTGKYRGWDDYRWNTEDNLSIREQHLADLLLEAEDHGCTVEQLRELVPWIAREYFGDWVPDNRDRVYRWNANKNSLYERQIGIGDQFICGVDFGWHDRTAFVVGRYNLEDLDTFDVFSSERYPKLPLERAVDVVKEIEHDYPGVLFIADPARMQLMQSLSAQADVHISPAEKAEKKDFIELVNRDLAAGRIRVYEPERSVLVKEMRALGWKTRTSGKIVEDPAVPNDCCDAFLYAYRYALHWMFEQPEDAPKVGTADWYERQAKNMRAKKRKLAKEKQRERLH